MLNKQGQGKIDWCDATWNPQSGCLHGCDYCYCQRLVKRFNFDFAPKFHPERLKDLNKLKQPSKIFVGSSGDSLGFWVPADNIQKIIDTIRKHPAHIFQWLTKNPARYAEFDFPHNCWLGTTIDGLPKTSENKDALLGASKQNLLFISFEPLIKDINIDLTGIDWIIIGADSNPGAKRPPVEWADKLIAQARVLNIPVFVKDNYYYKSRIKEFPEFEFKNKED